MGTGEGTSVNQLANILEDAAGVRVGRTHEAARPGELRHSRLDTGHLRALGWTCSFTLEEGLRETYQHIERESETT